MFGLDFCLSPAIQAIESQGLGFFKDATQPRGRKSKYPAWRETPVPYTWTSEGAWTGLTCIPASDTSKFIWKIIKNSELPGSYYTDLGNYRVVVLPKLGFVTFTYSD